MTYVDIISGDCMVEFEERLTKIIQSHERRGYEIVNIKYGYCPSTVTGQTYSAMIIYRDKAGEQNE